MIDSVHGLESQVVLGAVFSYLLQILKKVSWFPILTAESAKAVKVFFAMLTSLCAVTGLTYVFDPVAHTVLISNFSLALVGHAIWQWATQFVMQEGWYQLVFNKPKALLIPASSAPVGFVGGVKK